MAMTDDRRGIECDLCGKMYKEKFIYYSAMIDTVEVDSTENKTGVSGHDKRTLDVDICEVCYENMKAKMLEVINKREKKPKKKKPKADWR